MGVVLGLLVIVIVALVETDIDLVKGQDAEGRNHALLYVEHFLL